MSYRFNFRDVLAQQDFLLEGLALTLRLSFVTMLLGLLIGVVGGALRLYGPRPVRVAVAAYVEAIRNTPLLVQLFLVFFGLPSLGVRLDATTASIIQSRTFRDFEVYIVVAALYLALALAFRVAFAGLYQLAFARR